MSAQARHDEAAAAKRGRAEVPELVIVGLLAAPGLAEDLAARLGRELLAPLHERLPRFAWLFVVRTDVRAGPPGLDADLVREARERMLAEGWDLSICLTELPLHLGRRPVTAYASFALAVGLVSVRAVGPLDVEERVRESVLRLVEKMARGREVRLVGGAVGGNLRLLAGMVRANRPWKLITRLSRALTAALGGAAFALLSPGVWKVAAGAGPPRMLALAVASILVTSASLVVAHDLWERSPGPRNRPRVALLNLAVMLTVLLGVLTLHLALLVITAATVGLLIPSGVLAAEFGRDVATSDYLQLAWLVSSLATVGGALGVVVENNLAVREAVHGYHADRSSGDP